MRRLDSLLMRCADKCAVPAGGALAVNRDDFSAMVTKEIRNNPLIEVIEKEVTEIPNNAITVIAAGPLQAKYYPQRYKNLWRWIELLMRRLLL